MLSSLVDNPVAPRLPQTQEGATYVVYICDVSAFMPLKNICIVSCVKAWKRGVGAENANFNEFKIDKLLWSYAYWKVYIFSYRPMQIAKNSDQFENLVFLIVGN